MGDIRPAHCYRWDSPTFTRESRTPSNSYITGIPGNKILHFTYGKPELYEKEISVIYKDRMMVRHNALESARIVAQKFLLKNIKENFSLLIRPYPHHVMRENAQASGAGADRVQQGMRQSFGKAVGRAAKVYKGQKLASIFVHPENLEVAKQAAERMLAKLPGEKIIVIEDTKKAKETKISDAGAAVETKK